MLLQVSSHASEVLCLFCSQLHVQASEHPCTPLLLVLLAHQGPFPAGFLCLPPFSLPCFDSFPFPFVSLPSASPFLAVSVSYFLTDFQARVFSPQDQMCHYRLV